MNALRAFQNNVWAIMPEALLQIQGVIDNKLNGQIDFQLLTRLEKKNKEVNSVFYYALSSKAFITSGEFPKDEKLTAIIPIKGSMFKSANLFSDVSGARSMEQIGRDIRQANEDERIGNIILKWDTPGGTVDGTETLSGVVKSSKKPLLSFIDGLLASAGVWGASGSPFIMAAGKTSLIGSIGTLCYHTDYSGWLSMNGIKEHTITATLSKDKVLIPTPASDTDIQKFKAEYLDPTNELFISTVKEGRKGSLKGTENIFTGKIYHAEDALKYGLIDRIGSFEDALEKGREMVQEANRIVINQNQNEANMNFPRLSDLFKGKKATLNDEEAATIEAALTDMVPKAELEALRAEKLALEGQLATAKKTIGEQEAEITKLKAEDAATGSHVGKKDDKETTDFAAISAQFDHNRAADSNPMIQK